MSDKPELKPCPFCGKLASTSKDSGGRWTIICSFSDCLIVPFGRALDEKSVISAWNQRADLAKPSEWVSVEKLSEAKSLLNELMATTEKECNKCQHVKRFSSTDGEWMDVCTAQEPEDVEEGLSEVTVVNKELFDANLCLDFKEIRS